MSPTPPIENRERRRGGLLDSSRGNEALISAKGRLLPGNLSLVTSAATRKMGFPRHALRPSVPFGPAGPERAPIRTPVQTSPAHSTAEQKLRPSFLALFFRRIRID